MQNSRLDAGRPILAGLTGVVVGILAGNGLIKTYDWRTRWTIPAPITPVYDAMTSRRALRQWWPSMEPVGEGDEALREGSTISFEVHQAPEVARFAPPFRIHCLYTDVEPERRLRQVVTGDLAGVLETLFAQDRNGAGTRVTFDWYVRVTNPALNFLGYAAEGAYRRSHDGVMREGEEGLRRYCARQASRPGADQQVEWMSAPTDSLPRNSL